jgi:hypothetical protein
MAPLSDHTFKAEGKHSLVGAHAHGLWRIQARKNGIDPSIRLPPIPDETLFTIMNQITGA